MSSESILTKEATLYISLGFSGSYILQVLSLRPATPKEVHLVLYDGVAFFGAIYEYAPYLPGPLPATQRARDATQGSTALDIQKDEQEERWRRSLPKRMDVVRMTPFAPPINGLIRIRELQIVDASIECLLGDEPIRLQQYMRRQKFIPKERSAQMEEESLGEPTKRVKVNENESAIHEHMLEQKALQCERENIVVITEVEKKDVNLIADVDEEDGKIWELMEKKVTNKIVPMEIQKPEETKTQLFIKPKPEHQIVSLIEEDQTYKPESIIQKKTIRIQRESISTQAIPVVSLAVPKSTLKEGFKNYDHIFISDLFERIPRFKLLCKVNYLNKCTSNNGKFWTKMMVVDEKGDEICCFVHKKNHTDGENRSIQLQKGGVYIFENGDVEQDKDGVLKINLSEANIVAEIHRFMWNFHPKKMQSLVEININSNPFSLNTLLAIDEELSNSKKQTQNEMHFMGIYKGLKYNAKLVQNLNLFSIVGILCDPIHERQITFSMFVDELSSLPLEGLPVSLRNMKVIHKKRTASLLGSKRSYILNQIENSHHYFADLLNASKKGTWRMIKYQNLSEEVFITRNIQQLGELLGRMEDRDDCFTQIDCHITKIVEKRGYNSCSLCRKETKPEKGLMTYCTKCKKTTQCQIRFTFEAEVADSTGSLSFIFSSDDMESLVNMSNQEYTNYGKEDRNSYLALNIYQNMLLKLKSQRIQGGALHFAVSAVRTPHRTALENIKTDAIEKKTSRSEW